MFPHSTDIMLDDFVVRDRKLIECDGIESIKVWIEKILRTEKRCGKRGINFRSGK